MLKFYRVTKFNFTFMCLETGERTAAKREKYIIHIRHQRIAKLSVGNMGLESRHVILIILTTLYCMTGTCTYVQRLYTLHNCLILCQPLSSLHRRFQKCFRSSNHVDLSTVLSSVLSTLSSATRISRDWVLITQIHPKSPT